MLRTYNRSALSFAFLMQTTPTSPKTDTSSGGMAPVLLLAASMLWCTYWFVHARGYWEDDAWIHLEFARSVSQGLGFAFNGHLVAGDTAPLWVLLLAGLHTLIADWLTAGKLLTVLGAVFGLSGIYAFARRITQSLLAERTARIFPAAIVLLVVVNPYTCYWIFSGMEPVTCAGLACWAVLAATRERPTKLSFIVACLSAGLGPLLRPEMFFLAVLLALPILGQWRRLDLSPVAKFFLAAVGILLLAGPSLVWSLYSLHAFGHLLPNTNAAKRAAPDDSVLCRLATIYLTGLPAVFAGAIAGLASLALHFSATIRSLRGAIASAIADEPSPPRADAKSQRMLPPTGWIFILWALISTLFYLANHTYVQTRYILITAPGLTAVIFAQALRLWPRIERWLYSAALAAALVVSIVVVVPFLRNKAGNCETSRQLALYMHDHLPQDAPVALYSIGQIAFQSQHPIVDTGGITRPGAVPYLNAPPESMAGWAQSEGARYYIEAGSPLPGSVPVFTVSAPYLGWAIHPSEYSETVPVSIWKLPTQKSDGQPSPLQP